MIGGFHFSKKNKSKNFFGSKKIITQRFNKPQLKGKLILIEGEYYRII